MSRQSGNFLMQALLALTLVFAFIPFMASRLALRDADSKMYAATTQVETVTTAARIFIRENATALSYGQTILSGNSFADTLEPYGLPLGFVPKTPLGQDMVLVIDKDTDAVSARLELSGGNLSGIQRAELARRIGFYATVIDDVVTVGIALNNVYSDVVRRNAPDVENAAFMTDLDMGAFSVENMGDIFAARAEFETGMFGTLNISGTESGRKTRNIIKELSATRTVFQSKTGEAALSLTRGALSLDSISARTVAKYGNTGNFISNSASVYDFEMTAGRTGFVGPLNWVVHGNVITDKINFSVERLDVASSLNMTRGQDVYINSDSLEYNSRSGIETNTISVANITLRDQTSSGMSKSSTGAVILDVRPAGTSILADALVDTIDNGTIAIIKNARDNDGKTVDCKSIISELDGVYNSASLAQYIICQYVFWQRLEHRIDIKQCIDSGRSNCV